MSNPQSPGSSKTSALPQAPKTRISSETPGRSPWVRWGFPAGALLGGVCAGILGLTSENQPAPTGDRLSAAAPVRSIVDPAEPVLPPAAPPPRSGLAVSPQDASSPALTATRLTMNGRSVEVVAGVALVKPLDPGQAEARLSAMGSRVLEVGEFSGLWRVAAPEGVSLERFLAQLERLPEFSVVQPEGVLRAASFDPDAARYRPYQWNLDQIQWDGLLDSEAVDVSQLGGVLVAVIDSGVAYEDRVESGVTYTAASDLQHSNIIPGPDYVDGDESPFDLSGHGTHIANVIGADGGAIGVAPHVDLMPLRVLDSNNSGSELGLVEAVSYAVANGADILNLSLSFSVGYVPGTELTAAIQAAADNDVLVVSSSGNNGLDQVPYPAAYASVLAVGASRLTEGLMGWVADYSNVGSGLDLVAPGGVSTLDVNDDGKPDAIAAQTIAPGDPSTLHYYLFAGTSQAAAHVSGAAAWLRAAGASAEEIRQALINTSVGTWGRRAFARREGVGILNASAALNAYLDGSSAVNTDDVYYVNLLPMMYSSGDHVSAIGYIQVIDSRGLPAKRKLVAGHWFGSDSSTFAVVTNSQGRAVVTATVEEPASEPALFGLEVDRVLDLRNRVAPAPVSFYYASAGMWSALDGWFSQDSVAGADLFFMMQPGANGLPSWVANSYLLKPVGPLNGFVPTSIVFNDGYLNALADLEQATFQEVTATFPEARAFGWGSATSATLRVADNVPVASGSTRRMAFAPFDPAMFFTHLTTVVPLLNCASSEFSSRNDAFLSQLDSGAVGAGVVIGIVGDGTVLGLVGDGTVIGIVGDGNVIGLVGDGTVLGLVGDGTVIGLVGDGTVIGLVGDGTVLGLVGDGTVLGLVGDGTVIGIVGDSTYVDMLGNSESVPLMLAASYSDETSAEPLSLEAPVFSPVQDVVFVASEGE